MLATSTRPAPNAGRNGNGKPAYHTVTALKRWSCDDNDLPPMADIKSIHIYDFDNTLFASPLPNKQIWNGPTVGQLASPDVFINGGWWHDSSILAATGEGADKEEVRAWKGWWNENIVQLVELSMQQKDALSVLLTGRSEHGFSELIKRIIRSKNLKFDMVCLKPNVGPAGQKFTSTMNFKQELLKDIVYTYKDANEIRIYEDRVKHTKGFRDFFFQFNKDLMNGQLPTSRQAIVAEVVQVEENATQLDPVTEIAEIQRIINSHNSQVQAGTTPRGMPPYQIKKTVFYTGYMIARDMSDRLASLVKLPQGTPEGDVRYLANSILITPKPAPKSILDKVGGIGNKVVWKVTGISCFENKLWAARVEPIPKTTKYYSENPSPTVVLAIRKGGRPADAARIQNWHPVPDEEAHIFESVVGEKVVLRIEEEHANESRYESYFPNKGHNKRAHSEDGNGRPPQQRPKGPGGYRGGNRDRGHGGFRNFSTGGRGGRGGGGHRGDRSGGGRGRGRGAGPSSSYRSLDDVDRNGPGQAGPDSYY
ncbi:hypothetical protein DPSP01_010024 [Paraphaeosphaeria sporulosa]|uniref:Swiss Army Knife RNA repair protein HAD domain-containing protein n=1 Tax=Paraphaeosphaeria sporulosa TaxID=1460663 RepID=A0A177C7G4_9PLEO|nr:uncharacterized protein CC84DRAFT_1219607 [Paraphaeosphaeria sporulosa]OAG02640.1 hypothetical protein CC84DRAFT_1219607 [Paraphaeosphaeria sporulosa]